VASGSVPSARLSMEHEAAAVKTGSVMPSLKNRVPRKENGTPNA